VPCFAASFFSAVLEIILFESEQIFAPAANENQSGGCLQELPLRFRKSAFSIRTFCRLTQGEKRLFQALANGTVWLMKDERLVLVEEILPQPVE
jgi:hypothetical protein